jgi:hypothetical protein
MFTLPRLPEERQRNVGSALEEHFKSKSKYSAEITQGALAVIEATRALGASDDLPMFTIDVATDGVLSAIYRIEQAFQKGLVTAVIPLGPGQQALLDAAILLDSAWFPSGIGFIRDSVGVQNAAMISIRKSLTDPAQGAAIKAAAKTLGLAPLVDHFLLHAALYAKKLGLAGEVVDSGSEPRSPSDVWHDLYVQLAIDVSSAYRADPAKQKTLLGSYESQLAEYRADQAKARKRAAKKAKAEAEAPKPEAEAPKPEADAAKNDEP